VIRHPNKAQGNNPLYRGGGSIGIIGAARMAFVVGKDPQDENRRVLASTKNNLAKSPQSLMFTLEEAQGGAVRVNWLGDSEVSAHELLATPREEEHADARSEAVEFLNDVLAEGPVSASRVKEEATPLTNSSVGGASRVWAAWRSAGGMSACGCLPGSRRYSTFVVSTSTYAKSAVLTKSVASG
jgi:hypothetical protein